MPRPAGRTATRQISATPHKQSPVKMLLTDDRREKAARLQTRHALQEIHMNEIRAAASPMRKLNQARPQYHDDSEPGTPQDENRHARPKKTSKQMAQLQQQQQQQQQQSQRDGLNLDEALNTPNNRRQVPILANFEEWMKLATDNKINATNSWNFALIDYFHDMSLLKDGPGGQVNFQKASCTLDGCVKIYTSRVDSVATETGRLLSGLADSANADGRKNRRGEDEDDEEGEDGEEGDDEDGTKKTKKKRAARSHEATLAPSFASLQVKKLELEFAVDPLFKKASADFDEGGAKGLLLNHLSIDHSGRIVFDSSDDAQDASNNLPKEHKEQQQQQQHEGSAVDGEQEGTATIIESDPPAEEDEDEEIDLDALAAKFFPDLTSLDHKDICPSMKTFELGNPASHLNIPFLKAPEEWKNQKQNRERASTPQPMNLNLTDQTGIFLDGSNDLGFDDDDDDDGALGGFDMPDNIGFGEGGEAWAKDAAMEPMLQPVAADEDPIEGPDAADGYTMSLQHRQREDAEQEMIHEYFDKAFNSRGKGRLAFTTTLENWRIQKIQKARQSEINNTTTAATRQKKEKEPFFIDFLSPISSELQALLAAPPANNSTISLPRSQLKTKGRNILDKDDELIDVKSMMRLWTKPKCRIVRRQGGMAVVDEGFGSKTRVGSNVRAVDNDDDDDLDLPKGDYDANFFADDEPALPFFDGPLPIDDDDDDNGLGMGGDDDEMGFVDAREMLSPRPEERQPVDMNGMLADDAHGIEAQAEHQQTNYLNAHTSAASQQQDLLPGSFGAQLVTQAGRRLRPEYVNYARAAKKVDVRALKENMWKGMSSKLISAFDAGLDEQVQQEQLQRPQTPALTDDPSDNGSGAGDGDIDMMDIDDAPSPVKNPHAFAPPSFESDADQKETLKFTDMIGDLRGVYPESQMKDISTSYCFICLLHLANEKGLVLEGGREDGEMNEIMVRRDPGVGAGYVGE